jgi:Protein of unknown function (DUF1569)
MQQRRAITYSDYQQLLADVKRLEQVGYDRLGQWTLGMACDHIARAMVMTITPGGTRVPRLIPPLLCSTVMRRIRRKGVPRGMPAPKSLLPVAAMTDTQGVETLADAINSIIQHPQSEIDHPLFGRIPKPTNDQVQFAHAAHHLSFLIPKSSTPQVLA